MSRMDFAASYEYPNNTAEIALETRAMSLPVELLLSRVQARTSTKDNLILQFGAERCGYYDTAGRYDLYSSVTELHNILSCALQQCAVRCQLRPSI